MGVMMATDDLYEFPSEYVGRKTYVSVLGHSRSVPKYKTYRGSDQRNHLLPEFGGDWSGLGGTAPTLIPDKGAYMSPMDRTVVEGRAAHREHMKMHGVLEAGDMPMTGNSIERSAMPSVRLSIQRAMQELNR